MSMEDPKPATFKWPFYYRTYEDQKAIQIKPSHDKTNHFSIIWTKDKKGITSEQFQIMDRDIRAYLAAHNNKLTFRIIVACKNCTYGRFDDEFEALILRHRRENLAIFRGKDLTLGYNDVHAPLKLLEDWTDDRPIMFHIHSKSDTDDADLNAKWSNMTRSPRNTLIELEISIDER